MPTLFDLMQFENGDELFNSRYDILVNKFLFQFGIRIGYLKDVGEKMFQDCDPATWDMCMLMYKLMREIWLETMEGDPIGKNEQVHIFHYKCGEQVCPLQNSVLDPNISPPPLSDGCVP